MIGDGQKVLSSLLKGFGDGNSWCLRGKARSYAHVAVPRLWPKGRVMKEDVDLAVDYVFGDELVHFFEEFLVRRLGDV